jgi:hypothetical protein
MGPVLLGLAVAAVVLALPFASRRLRAGLTRQTAGTAAVPRPASLPGRGTVPAAEPQPRGEVTGPYGYDNGLITGEKP